MEASTAPGMRIGERGRRSGGGWIGGGGGGGGGWRSESVV